MVKIQENNATLESIYDTCVIKNKLTQRHPFISQLYKAISLLAKPEKRASKVVGGGSLFTK